MKINVLLFIIEYILTLCILMKLGGLFKLIWMESHYFAASEKQTSDQPNTKVGFAKLLFKSKLFFFENKMSHIIAH